MHEYIKEKARVLADFGLTDKKAVAEYLEEKCEGITDEAKIYSKVDFEARKLIDNFFNGDRSLVKRSKKADVNNVHYEDMRPLALYAKLKRTYPNCKVVTRSEIIAVAGERGFHGMQDAKYIKRAGTIGKEKVFKFNR